MKSPGTEKSKRKDFWFTLIAVLILSPVFLMVIIGLFATCVKFFQICWNWIGM